MDRLRHIRIQTGYSQQDLADESGVGQHTISEIELGKRTPQGRTLRRLAKVMGVEVREFFEPTANPLGEALLDLDPADLEAWTSRVGSIPELKRAAKSLWSLYGRAVPAEGGERLSELGRKLDIINERVTELAPEPLATITERQGRPTEIHFLREPTLEERARVRAEYPDALEVEARETALVW